MSVCYPTFLFDNVCGGCVATPLSLPQAAHSHPGAVWAPKCEPPSGGQVLALGEKIKPSSSRVCKVWRPSSRSIGHVDFSGWPIASRVVACDVVKYCGWKIVNGIT